MLENVLELCRIETKTPSDCTNDEINQFHRLVLKGGKVMKKGLLNRVQNCELLAFCYYNNTLVGISSIKKPNQNYVKRIIDKTGINRKPSELNFEIGYSFTEVPMRKNGISSLLKSKLIEEMTSRKGIVFSTTAIQSSQKFLEANGFVKRGNPYDGDNDEKIFYFEKSLSRANYSFTIILLLAFFQQNYVPHGLAPRR